MIAGPRLPFREDFYHRLAEAHASFRVVNRAIVPANRGHGFRVRAGQTFRFEMIKGAQILDVDLFAAHDPTEHYSAATQLCLEGGRVAPMTRVWGTPPHTPPLATVIADQIAFRDIGHGYKDHKPYGAQLQPTPLDPLRWNGSTHLLRQPSCWLCDGRAWSAGDPR
jgi:uncharacterized protein YcgI (DUF1989 family)